MATEYFIVKPSQKKTFYLGKRISNLEGLVTYKDGIEPQYPSWEWYEDVVFDLQENSRYFLEGWPETTIGQIWDFCSAIYSFCDDKVYLDNDCSDNCKVWKDWECEDIFEELFEMTDLEKWSELFLLVPEEYWIKEKGEVDSINIVNEYETVRNYLLKLKEEKC